MPVRKVISSCLLLVALCHAAESSTLPNAAELKPLLRDIADWSLTLDLQTNNIINVKDSLRTSIFINGNLARVLLAAHRIFDGNATYLEAGLEWCDTFTDLQHFQDTHDGRSNAAGWWDTGYHELFIADTGTAVTTLALCYDLVKENSSVRVHRPTNISDRNRPAKYLNSMLRFADFVVNGTKTTPNCVFSPGCAYDPDGNESETTATWVVSDDPSSKDFGALGDGYYQGRINLMPYTISTATTGGAFFSELATLLDSAGPAHQLVDLAHNAATWLLNNVQANGTIPYYINPPTTVDHTYQCVSYSAEAIVDADLRDIAKVKNGSEQEKAAQRVVEYLLGQQQPNGELIGPKASQGEQQRSPRAVSLMQWWHERTGDEKVAASIKSYTDFLADELHNTTSMYGLRSYALVTGFAGLALADLIQPWCTFSRGLNGGWQNAGMGITK